MVEARRDVEFWKKPQSKDVVMITGFRQWADAGSVSSALPEYLIQQTHAELIGGIHPEGFYLFQIPGTHDMMRPVVRHVEGYPENLQLPRNDFFMTGDDERSVILFLGEEPHMDVERYVSALLGAARTLGVRRIVGLGGVYGELPYDKERIVSATYSLPMMKEELTHLAVTFSDYQGGASIDSIIARRAGEVGMQFAGLYAFVPAYDFSLIAEPGNTIRIENDYTAWLGVMRRVNYYLKVNFDLLDLEKKSRHLIDLVSKKIDELDQSAPQLGVREYIHKLSEEFHEVPFNPLDEVWDEELKRLLNKFDEENDQDDPDQESEP